MTLLTTVLSLAQQQNGSADESIWPAVILLLIYGAICAIEALRVPADARPHISAMEAIAYQAKADVDRATEEFVAAVVHVLDGSVPLQE